MLTLRKKKDPAYQTSRDHPIYFLKRETRYLKYFRGWVSM
jgi:hypothetical protein